MFIHIGNGNVIRSRNVIAIIDYQFISSSTIMEEMVSEAKRQKKLVGPTVDAKSVMITRETIYFSTLSVTTLKKRASIISTISKLDDYSDEVEEV
jgi:regulator of extracellular matrix RemA (YlzA/DUF370 family)